MPKRLRSRSSLGIFDPDRIKNTGHKKKPQNIDEIAQTIIDYTSVEINNNLIQINNVDIEPQEPVTLPNNLNIDIPNNIFTQNINIFNGVVEEVTTIPTIPEDEIKLISETFVGPYLEVGPYKLPPQSEFARLIELIDGELSKVNEKPRYKLDLFRGLLDVLVRGRSMYFYDLQLETQVETLRKKICELEQLVLKYSTELALCNGNESGYAVAGCVGIKLNKPKNLIYAQALLNINMAWYLYLYNTKKIEYDKYQGVIQFVNEKGKQAAYNELVTLLDEKYKDIEDELDSSCDNSGSGSSDNSGSNCGNSSSNSSCESSSSSSCGESSDSGYSSNSSDPPDGLNFCKIPTGGFGLVVFGSLDISQPEKFGKQSGLGENQLQVSYCNIAVKKNTKCNKKKKKNKKKSCKKCPEPDDLFFHAKHGSPSDPRALVVPGMLCVEQEILSRKSNGCRSTFRSKKENKVAHKFTYKK